MSADPHGAGADAPPPSVDATAVPAQLGGDLILRPLAAGDAPALSRFYQSLSGTTTHFFEPFRDKSIAAMQTVANRSANGEDIAFIVVEPQGGVIAHAWFGPVGAEAPHLGIGIADAWQERGLGKRLLALLIDAARTRAGRRAIGLTVMKTNARALHLYRKLGFLECRSVTFRSPDDSFEMRLDLTSADHA